MPSLDLTRALSLSHAGKRIASCGHLGQTIWTRPSGPPEIAILTGSGYLGSTYVSTVADQWYADDDAILGATGSTWTMDLANEGKAIRCGDSNMIEMWVPDDLTDASTTDVWTADGQVTADGKVTQWVNRISSRAQSLQQATAANQPTAGTINGMPCAVWPNVQNTCMLTGPSRTSSYAMAVMQYRDGVSTEFVAPTYAGMFSGTNLTNNGAAGRIMIDASGAVFSTQTSWAYGTWEMQRNAVVETSFIPLPLSIIEFSGPSRTGNPRLGNETYTTTRGWSGPICLYALATAEPSAADRAKLLGYAAHRYGIAASLPSDHPYKSAAPRIQ